MLTDRAIRYVKAALFWATWRSDHRYLRIKSGLVLWAARKGHYEHRIYQRIPRLLPPGAVAVDVGANCGVYTRLFLKCVGTSGHVYAFEPNPAYLPSLRAAGLSQVLSIFEQGIADRHYRAYLDIPRIQGGAPEPALATLSTRRTPHALEVDVTTLDSALGTLSRLDLLKVDVEGGEIAVLRGAQKLIEAFHPIMVIETLHVPALAAFVKSMRWPYMSTDGSVLKTLEDTPPRSDATYLLRWVTPDMVE